MTLSPWAVAALAVTLAGLCAWLWRAGVEQRRLRRRLDAAARELESLQHSFSRFAPNEIIEEIIASGVATRGERKEVTALFADVVGFTALSESIEPGVLLRILNGYFERMSRAITDHRGYVSTFLGDGILALFGALQPNPWQANDAAHAALAMRGELEVYNKELAADGLPTIAIGVGIHRGSGVAGLVGSRDLVQFALVGRTVNLAARVQDLTRGCDGDILATAAVREGLDPRFALRPMPPAEVRGVDDPVATWAIDCFDTAVASLTRGDP